MFSYGCNTAIKNDDAQIVIEEGTAPNTEIATKVLDKAPNEELLSESLDTTSQTYWVGFFNPHKEVDLQGKYIAADEGLYWGRRNKISISIDKIIGDSIMGHSVVAGNHRPFYGKAKPTEKGKEYVVREPGDDKYDGQFIFKIVDDRLIGVWDAYKSIDISKREYKLTQMSYKYDRDIMLKRSGRYGNWDKFIDHGTQIEIYDEGTPDEEVYEWVKREYASSTEKVYEINASNTELTKDITQQIIRRYLARNQAHIVKCLSYVHRDQVSCDSSV